MNVDTNVILITHGMDRVVRPTHKQLHVDEVYRPMPQQRREQATHKHGTAQSGHQQQAGEKAKRLVISTVIQVIAGIEVVVQSTHTS